MCGLSGERRAWWEPASAQTAARERTSGQKASRLGLGERQLGVEAGEDVERDPERGVAVVRDRRDGGARRVADPPRPQDVAEVEQAVGDGRAAGRADRVVVGDVAVDRLDGQRVSGGQHGGERRHRALHQGHVLRRRGVADRRDDLRPAARVPLQRPVELGVLEAGEPAGAACGERAEPAPRHGGAVAALAQRQPVDPGHQSDVVVVGADDLLAAGRGHRHGHGEAGGGRGRGGASPRSGTRARPGASTGWRS